MIVRELISLLGYKVDDKGLRDKERREAASARRSMGIFRTAAGFIAAQMATAMGGGLLQMIEGWAGVDDRVRLATQRVGDHATAMQGLYQVAQATRASFTGTADLFAAIARSSENLALTQDQILALTGNINRAIVIGGAGAQQSAAAILQLGQALSSGTIQGDEFRSLMENAPRLMRAIADGMGRSYGELRAMSQKGLLTADVVVKALMQQGDALRREFDSTNLRLGQAFTIAGNMLGKLVYETGKAADAFSGAARAVVWGATWITGAARRVTDMLGGAANAVKVLGAVLASVTTIALLAFSRWAVAAAVANAPLIALAASLAAIYLIAEDLYVWAQGGDSLIGGWIGDFDKFVEPFRAFQKLFQGDWSGAWDSLKTAFTEVEAGLAVLLAAVVAVRMTFLAWAAVSWLAGLLSALGLVKAATLGVAGAAGAATRAFGLMNVVNFSLLIGALGPVLAALTPILAAVTAIRAMWPTAAQAATVRDHLDRERERRQAAGLPDVPDDVLLRQGMGAPSVQPPAPAPRGWLDDIIPDWLRGDTGQVSEAGEGAQARYFGEEALRAWRTTLGTSPGIAPGALIPPQIATGPITTTSETTINITTRDDPAAIAAAAERGATRAGQATSADLHRALGALGRDIQRASPGAEAPAAAY